MSTPRATMRLQFHKGFTFDDALAVVPYLARLGISHLYSSPILKARSGSLHGYDVIDPTTINPELGGDAGFRRLADALRQAGLGIILDIVPNHMAVGGDDNLWWLDVVQNGRQSPYARYFDIDWEPGDPALHGKVLLPFLGRPYGAALASGEITLQRAENTDRYEARYFQHCFPIRPADARYIAHLSLAAFDAATPSGQNNLHDLLERQNFRLAWWKTANDAINWRRFFDINELAAMRVEDDAVFEATHALIFQLYAEGLIDGVRIDHIDGLADPAAYCRRLRSRLVECAAGRSAPADTTRAYIVVEKILGPAEILAADWQCDGTSGYDFMDQVSRLLHDPNGAEPLGELWAAISGRSALFAQEEIAARREIIERSFAAQLDAAVAALDRLGQADRTTRDVASPAIRRALVAILVHMHVYRTYPDKDPAAAGLRYLTAAADAAAETCWRGDRDIIRTIADWLGTAAADGAHANLRREALRRFQQLSAPLAAKAVEDTAFYRYGRLLSRIDVGFDAAVYSDEISDFHRHAAERRRHFPAAMLATATHDHKRGEDVRARLAVLSEMPDAWAAALARWLDDAEGLFSARDGVPMPSRGDAAILLQMMVGAWPPDLKVEDRAGCAAYAERLVQWQVKALREAKLATEWADPDEAYEAAARNFLMQLFEPRRMAAIAAFAARIAPAGAVNGITQTLLKLTSPGLPDIYQGTEYWDLSLVDPDNRRPVDFAARTASLTDKGSLSALAATWRDGRIKQALIGNTLMLRRSAPELFADGDYRALQVEGPAADHIIAYARQYGPQVALVVAACRVASWLADDALRVPPSHWAATRIKLGEPFAECAFHDIFTGRTATIQDGYLPLEDLFEAFPAALLASFDPIVVDK